MTPFSTLFSFENSEVSCHTQEIFHPKRCLQSGHRGLTEDKPISSGGPAPPVSGTNWGITILLQFRQYLNLSGLAKPYTFVVFSLTYPSSVQARANFSYPTLLISCSLLAKGAILDIMVPSLSSLNVTLKFALSPIARAK